MNDKPRNRRIDFIERYTSDPEFAKKRQKEWQLRKEKKSQKMAVE